jgi:hypothetical protein
VGQEGPAIGLQIRWVGLVTLRNSDDYAALVDMASGDRLLWSTVRVAARGMVAYAEANDWMLKEGKASADPLWLADCMYEFGDASEQLRPLWSRFLAGQVDETELVNVLEKVVVRMENWRRR